MIFVYDFHPGSETLLAKHFSPTGPDAPNGYADAFSNDPNAPRPYSHQKNTLLRAQHSSLLPEGAIWNFIIQVTAALRVIHAAGLACRALDPTKIILTARSRLRLSCAGVMDVLTFDANVTNPQAHIPHYQVIQSDFKSVQKSAWKRNTLKQNSCHYFTARRFVCSGKASPSFGLQVFDISSA